MGEKHRASLITIAVDEAPSMYRIYSEDFALLIHLIFTVNP